MIRTNDQRTDGPTPLKAALVGAVTMGLLIGWQNYAEASSDHTSTEQWVNACNGVKGVTALTGIIDVTQINGGLEAFESFGLRLPSDKATTKELCLSLVASAETQTPVYVVEKPDVAVADHQPPAVTRSLETRAFVDRMTELGVQLFTMDAAQGQQSLDAMMDIDATMAHETLHFGTILGKKRLDRSFAINGDQACAIGLDSEPLAGYVENRLQGEGNDTVKRYMIQHGNATEFWHEVAHCNIGLVAQDLDNLNAQSEKGQNLSSGASCSSSYSDSRIGQAEASEAGAASIREASQASVKFTGALDTRSLFAIREEAMADEWATNKVARMGGPAKGCNYEKGNTHPWQKYRVMDSIQNPSLNHMTWLYPWIEGESAPVQRQMMADAFKGAFLAAKATLPRYRYEELVRRKSVIAGTSMFNKPAKTADPERAEAWKHWLIRQSEDTYLSGLSSTE